MPTDLSPERYPLLFDAVKHYVDWHEREQEYMTKRSIERDIQRTYNYREFLLEAGLNSEHPNATSSFRRVLYPVVRHFANSRTGWWTRSRGQGAQYFHETFATPEDCRDGVNNLLRDREKDQESLERLVAVTETKCGQLGWIFDPQYDEAGSLIRVEVWEPAVA